MNYNAWYPSCLGSLGSLIKNSEGTAVSLEYQGGSPGSPHKNKSQRE